MLQYNGYFQNSKARNWQLAAGHRHHHLPGEVKLNAATDNLNNGACQPALARSLVAAFFRFRLFTGVSTGQGSLVAAFFRSRPPTDVSTGQD